MVRQWSAKPRTPVQIRSVPPGRVAELVYAFDLKSNGHIDLAGSSPASPTKMVMVFVTNPEVFWPKHSESLSFTN